jgi:hypothetical protein
MADIVYTRFTWVDNTNPAGSTPSTGSTQATASRLNNIEAGILAVTTQANTALSTATSAASGSIPTSQKGAANGVATLDGTSKLSAAQVPDLTSQVNAAMTTALRTTDCNISYGSGAQPLRTTGTADTLRRVRWIGTAAPSTATGYALTGDVWERTV